MRVITCYITVWVFFIQLSAKVHAQSDKLLPQALKKVGFTVDDFENYTAGTIPDTWFNLSGDKQPALYDEKEKKEYKYKIVRERGNKFLRYEGKKAKHLNFPLINEQKENVYKINIYETPILSWRVRPHSWPQNANEDKEDRNDSVASIYVVFDMGHVLFRKVPKSIRYTWSSTLDKGTKLSKFFGNQKVVVVASGEKKKGQWVTFKRNIVKDYRRLFGDDPPKHPLAILILSDGDSTGSFVKVDYDDIMLLPKD